MHDILVKKLQSAAAELYDNLDKKAHVQDVLKRLEAASESYPYDFVIRHMEDIFRKQANKNPNHIVTAEEFEAIRQDLWGLNTKSAVKELFPDLVFAKQQTKKEEQTYTFANDAVRETIPVKSDALIANNARDMVLSCLKNAGIGYAQTQFSKGMYSGYDSEGSPSDGVLLFQANIISKAGESTLAIPVTLENGILIHPDSFASDTMRYPLTKKGVSDFALGLPGIKTDKEIDREYVFGHSEVRDLPTIDNSAQEMLDEAKERVYAAFRDAGIGNCQIRLGSFTPDEDESSGVITFSVKLPFSTAAVNVPVTVDNSHLYSPFKFSSVDGAEFDLTPSGLKQFVTANSCIESSGVAHRIAGDGEVRTIAPSSNDEGFRGLISKKLADDLSKFGAISPQVFYVTSSNTSGKTTAAFIGTFGSARGNCQIAIPILIEGSSVKTPRSFFGEDEKKYDFNVNGVKNYVHSKADFQLNEKTGFYGDKHVPTLAGESIDLGTKVISRQEGFISEGRSLEPVDDTFAKVVAQVRESLASDLMAMGAVNPQVFYQKREDRDSDSLLKFTVAFSSGKGIKKATVPILISRSGMVKPNRFLGEDNKMYDFARDGIAAYLKASEHATTEMEEQISSKFNLLSYDKLRSIVRESMETGDSHQIASAMSAIGERFGEEAARNCLTDLVDAAQIRQNDFATKCGSCPFYRSGKNPTARAAEDTCLKFQTRVANIRIAGHHSQCRLVKTAAREEQPFDGAIVQSQIKLT